MQLSLRGREPKLADVRVRKAILGLLDVDLLAAVGAGSDNTVTLAQAQVRAPSDPGYEPTAPPAMSRTAALNLLTDAGYQIETEPVTPPSTPTGPAAPASAPSSPSPTATSTTATTTATSTPPQGITHGRVSKNGQTLSLVIGVANNDPTSAAVANTAADQLRSVGIAASVLALDPAVLYGQALIGNRVDAVVGWRHAGGDLATVLASRYGCPALEATQVSSSPSPTPSATKSASPPRRRPPPPPRRGRRPRRALPPRRLRRAPRGRTSSPLS